MNSPIKNNIEQKIKNTVFERLHPAPLFVSSKMLVIHLVSAIITLAVCPQFGKKIFSIDINLMDYFMMLTGPRYCIILCGVFFIGTSLFINSIFLNHDELRLVRQHRTMTVFSLVLISFGSFVMFDPVLFLESTIFWFIGAIIGGYLSLEVGEFFKRHVPLFN